jgi:hypothetical protein
LADDDGAAGDADSTLPRTAGGGAAGAAGGGTTAAPTTGATDGLRSCFGQMFRQLHFVSPQFLRCSPGQRVFGVEYEGEGGTDAGGLFRDLLSHVCRELQSDAVPLFIPCPNARAGVGINQVTSLVMLVPVSLIACRASQDGWVPSASASSALHVAMFAFVGKLMGLAVRGQVCVHCVRDRESEKCHDADIIIDTAHAQSRSAANRLASARRRNAHDRRPARDRRAWRGCHRCRCHWFVWCTVLRACVMVT